MAEREATNARACTTALTQEGSLADLEFLGQVALLDEKRLESISVHGNAATLEFYTAHGRRFTVDLRRDADRGWRLTNPPA